MSVMKSDLEIAQEANLHPIENIASNLDIPKEALINYGPFIAKVDPDKLNNKSTNAAKLIRIDFSNKRTIIY